MTKLTGRFILALGTALLALSTGPGYSAPAGFNEGVQAYNTRQYNLALGYFSQAVRAEPSNPTIHYYMGLAYQGMNQMTLARQQYEWVASTNSSLAGQAARALQNLSRYQPSRQGGASAVSASPGFTGAPVVVTSNPERKLNGRLKIYYFTADW